MKCYSIQYKNQTAKPLIEALQQWDNLFCETVMVNEITEDGFVYRPHDVCVSKPFLLQNAVPSRRHDEMRLSSFCAVRVISGEADRPRGCLDVSPLRQVASLIFDSALFIKDDVLSFAIEVDEPRNEATLYCEHSLVDVSLFLARVDINTIPGWKILGWKRGAWEGSTYVPR